MDRAIQVIPRPGIGASSRLASAASTGRVDCEGVWTAPTSGSGARLLARSAPMKDDGPELSDREKQAIEAIRRELDREFGDGVPEPSNDSRGGAPEEPPNRTRSGPRTVLLVGAGILGLATLVAATAGVVSKIMAPDPSVSLRGNPSTPRARVGGSLAATDPALPSLPPERRPVSAPERIGSRLHRSECPCPPATHAAASPRAIARERRGGEISLAAARRSGPRGDSGSSAVAFDNLTRERRHVEAP